MAEFEKRTARSLPMLVLLASACSTAPAAESGASAATVAPSIAQADGQQRSAVAGGDASSNVAAGAPLAAGSAAAPAAHGGAGMGGAAAAGMAGPPTFTAIYTDILTKGSTGNCMFGACHGGEANPNSGGLQIPAGDKTTAYKHLVGVKSTSAVCMGKTYVVPHDSKNSLLIHKLSATPPCGARMPIGAPLTDSQMAQITAWIDMGAKDD